LPGCISRGTRRYRSSFCPITGRRRICSIRRSNGSCATAWRRSPGFGRSQAIAKATQDIERDFHFNTAISAVMELVNALYAFEATSHDAMPAGERAALLREAVETTLLLLGPIAPHVTEELWAQLGHRESLFARPWPEADPAALVEGASRVRRVQQPGARKVGGVRKAGGFAPDDAEPGAAVATRHELLDPSVVETPAR